MNISVINTDPKYNSFEKKLRAFIKRELGDDPKVTILTAGFTPVVEEDEAPPRTAKYLNHVYSYVSMYRVLTRLTFLYSATEILKGDVDMKRVKSPVSYEELVAYFNYSGKFDEVLESALPIKEEVARLVKKGFFSQYEHKTIVCTNLEDCVRIDVCMGPTGCTCKKYRAWHGGHEVCPHTSKYVNKHCEKYHTTTTTQNIEFEDDDYGVVLGYLFDYKDIKYEDLTTYGVEIEKKWFEEWLKDNAWEGSVRRHNKMHPIFHKDRSDGSTEYKLRIEAIQKAFEHDEMKYSRENRRYHELDGLRFWEPIEEDTRSKVIAEDGKVCKHCGETVTGSLTVHNETGQCIIKMPCGVMHPRKRQDRHVGRCDKCKKSR